MGINDKGEKVGLKNIDDTYTRITNGIRDEKMDELTLQELLGIKRTRAYNLAKEMAAAGLIKIVGRGKERRYIAV